MTKTADKKNEAKTTKPTAVEDPPEIEREVIKDAKNRLDILYQRRSTAMNSLQQAVQTAKSAEQQSFVLRGRISVFDEEIVEIQKRYGLKEPVQ